jgi:hypothetical protein
LRRQSISACVIGSFSWTRLLCPTAINSPARTNAEPIGIPPCSRLFRAASIAACMNLSTFIFPEFLTADYADLNGFCRGRRCLPMGS